LADKRMPVVFIPHGGGPWPFVDLPMFDSREVASLAEFLRSLPRELGKRPRSLLVVSAHWEERVATVMSGPHPPLFYDYYGFPPEAYALTWPAPGDPDLANRTRMLLSRGGFETAEDAGRGFDHGAFIPLKVMYPEADIPTVQLSLLEGLDPAEHLALGEVLAPLRDEDVLIVGSGMSYHNLHSLMSRRGHDASEAFDAWLRDAATAEPAQRAHALQDWQSAPQAHQAHPRPEHLLPLLVVSGAAGSDRGRVAYSGLFGNARISAFAYG
jgi:aromatic ring-opening dioxygenase catalytic subunit (LigB family)